MSNAILLALCGVAFATSAVVTRAIVFAASRVGLIDVPNERSSHSRPTPRGGGVGILVGVVAALALAAAFDAWPLPLVIGGATLMIALVGLIDDRVGLPAKVRFAVHIAAATVVVVQLGGFARLPLPHPCDVVLGPWTGSCVAVIWIVAL